MEKNNKNLNVPNLRFPEFSGEWEKCTIGDITRNFSLRNKDKIQYPMFSVTNSRGFVPQSEQFEDREMIGEDIKAYKIIHEGDFAYNPARINVGSIAKYNKSEPCMISSLYVCFKALPQINNEWLIQLLKTPKMNFYYNVNGEGGVRVYLFYPNFARIRTSYPSLAEQQKIASFLSLLDQRIETQRKIIEDLKKLKDAIAEKLFCCPDDESPELRVENSSDRWNLYRLKDVCQRITERNSQESSSLVLTIAAQYGLVSQTDFFNKSVASENLSNYYLIRKGDFAYNKSYSGEYAWGAVKRLELYEKGVLSPLYICFRPNSLIVYSDFLCHYFETHKWHNGIAQIAGEGARNHGLLNISISDFFETIHRFPELPEQQRIASYLNSLSDKISLANKVLESYTRQKQYLLARMFI